jgi:RNA polymerase sigma factor (sigma-70 family)
MPALPNAMPLENHTGRPHKSHLEKLRTSRPPAGAWSLKGRRPGVSLCIKRVGHRSMRRDGTTWPTSLPVASHEGHKCSVLSDHRSVGAEISMTYSTAEVAVIQAPPGESTGLVQSEDTNGGVGRALRPDPDRPDGVHPRDPVDRSTVGLLVEAAADGDQDAWNALVERFASTVWAIARGHRLNSGDAADVFQTTWLRLLENLTRIDQPERVGAWLATTARRECLRVIRLAGRQVASGDDLEVLPEPATSQSLDGQMLEEERKRVVNELVDQLPMRSQFLLRLLSADSPLSYREISAALSMPIGSIGPTRARALDQLRRLAVSTGFDLKEIFFA